MARNVVNLAVWLVFVCKLVYQKHNKSVHICKSYCEKNQWHLFLCGHGVYIRTLLIWKRRSNGRLSTRHRLSSTCSGQATEQRTNINRSVALFIICYYCYCYQYSEFVCLLLLLSLLLSLTLSLTFPLTLTLTLTLTLSLLCGVLVSGSLSKDHRFDSQTLHCHITTVGKFSRVWLRH